MNVINGGLLESKNQTVEITFNGFIDFSTKQDIGNEK